MVVISIDSAANAKMNDFIICSLDVEIDAGGTLLPYLLVASFIVPGPDPAIRLADYSRDFRFIHGRSGFSRLSNFTGP